MSTPEYIHISMINLINTLLPSILTNIHKRNKNELNFKNKLISSFKNTKTLSISKPKQIRVTINHLTKSTLHTVNISITIVIIKQ